MTEKINTHVAEACCVIVTYHPDPDKFGKVLSSIKNQSSPVQIIIVDNSNTPCYNHSKSDGMIWLSMNGNAGIAAAQNAGIKYALKHGAQYVWLSDQDTLYPSEFLTEMLKFHKKCETEGIKIGAAVPAYMDTNKGTVQPFINHVNFFAQPFSPKSGLNKITHAIASGKLISKTTLETVGLMQENLFIDWVDLEWCWRATNIFGFQNIGNGDIVIHHTMGDGWVKFLGKKITIRSPIRHYYMIRNAVHIAIYSKSVNMAVRRSAVFSAIVLTLIYPLLAPSHKLHHLRATLTGFFDGLRNRLGQKTL